jgi:mannose-6-phosphate isomerase-like protein (cupin superfamily)
MDIRKLKYAAPFTTKDGSVIRSLLDHSNAPVQNQSLAEATIGPGLSTQRHRHARTEEIYYVVQGVGKMEIDGECKEVGVGDAILIPPGAAHKLSCLGTSDLKILCCCAPPYSHEDTEILETL